ncbi:hypothetical protein [Campylobacter troglodytis]|nr:hypothetical protein [Campylobacter troglodytis]
MNSREIQKLKFKATKALSCKAFKLKNFSSFLMKESRELVFVEDEVWL